MKFSPEALTSVPEELGLEYLNSLYRYAMTLTKQPATAEDLVCETYLSATEASSRLRKDSSTKGWLFTILRNRWVNELSKRCAGRGLLEIQGEKEYIDEIPENSPDAYVLLEESEDVRMKKAISRLPSKFQEVLILREFEELSYQEIATVMNCPAGTVMSRLSLARSKLRILLVEDQRREIES